MPIPVVKRESFRHAIPGWANYLYCNCSHGVQNGHVVAVDLSPVQRSGWSIASASCRYLVLEVRPLPIITRDHEKTIVRIV